MTSLQFVAAIVDALAWPIAAVVMAALLREALTQAIHRMRSLEFPGGRVSFDTLPAYEKMVEAATKEAESPASDDGAIARHETAVFGMVEELASVAPGQAVIDAWGLLEYQLNSASDRLAPDLPHGWPQVARNLESWNMWPLLRPAVEELRRLRDYTVQSGRPPSKEDAARYVSVAQDVATSLRTAFPPHPNESQGGDE